MAVDVINRVRNRSGRRGLVVIAAITMAALFGAGCTQAGNGDEDAGPPIEADEDGDIRLDFVNEAPGDPVSGGTLAFGLAAETDGWKVTDGSWGASAYAVGNALFDPLAVYSTDYTAVPYLAEAFEPNDDYTTWQIKLRQGPVFHDGTPVDAAAIAQNLEAHTTALLTSTAVSFIDTVSVVDDLTVEVTMIKPWSTFPDTLTSQVGYVMAPAMIDDPDGSRRPVGSGPFVFESWTPGQNLRANRFEDYWRDGLPYLDAVEFQVLTDNQTRSRALESGQIQAMQAGDAAQIIRLAEAAADGELQLFTDNDTEVEETFIALNTEVPPFDDPIARQALAYAVDRQALSDQAFEGLFEPAVGPYKPSSPLFVDAGVPEFDPDRARELVSEYEEKYGEPLRFTANIVPVAEIRRIAETLQQQAADVGIEVELEALDQPTLIVRALTGNYQATGFILFGSPSLDREYVFIADFPEGNPLNFTRNKNPVIVAELDRARSTQDPDVQAEAFAEVQRQLAADGNFVFMVHNLGAVAFANDIYGLADPVLPDGEFAGRTTTPRLTNTWINP